MPVSFQYILWPSVVLLLILLIRFWKRINLLLLRLVHGKYSYPYLNTYKKYFLFSPFPESTKEDILTHISPFYQPSPITKKFSTDQKITFYDFSFGSSYRQLIRKKGKPNSLSAFRIVDNIVLIRGYNETIFDTDVRVLYFFVNHIFFMGMFYFKEIEKPKAKEVTDALRKKYGISDQCCRDFIVEGSNKVSLYCQDNIFSLSLRYFCHDLHDVNLVLDEYMNSMTVTFKEVEELSKKNKWSTLI